MSAIKGLWSSWKPVNEANNHGLDMVDIKAQVEVMIGATDVFVVFEFREYKVISKDQTYDVISIQLLVQIKKGSYKAYGSFILVEIEVIGNSHKVVRVSNKKHPGLMNELKVLAGDEKGEHLKFGDDYPVESFLVPATHEIQKVLNKIFKIPYDGPWPFYFPRPNAPVPLSNVIALAFVCRLQESGRIYTVLAKAIYDGIPNAPQVKEQCVQGEDQFLQGKDQFTQVEDQYVLLTIYSNDNTYKVIDAKSVPSDDYVPGQVGGFSDWQAMNAEVENIALLVKNKVCAGLQDCNTYVPRRFRGKYSTREPCYQIEIKVKKNVVLGSREVFAPQGVVFVDVQLNEGDYRISNLRIVPSIDGELIYLPTDWSLVFEGNDRGENSGEKIHKLVSKFYPNGDFHVVLWKYKCDLKGFLVKALVKLGSKENFELVEIRCYPPFPNNVNAELKSRIPVELV